MKPDISTLLKPDILTLRRHTGHTGHTGQPFRKIDTHQLAVLL